MPDVSVKCPSCNRSWHFTVYGYMCPNCGASVCYNCYGNQIVIEERDIDEDNPIDTATRVIVDCDECNGTGLK